MESSSGEIEKGSKSSKSSSKSRSRKSSSSESPHISQEYIEKIPSEKLDEAWDQNARTTEDAEMPEEKEKEKSDERPVDEASTPEFGMEKESESDKESFKEKESEEKESDKEKNEDNEEVGSPLRIEDFGSLEEKKDLGDENDMRSEDKEESKGHEMGLEGKYEEKDENEIVEPHIQEKDQLSLENGIDKSHTNIAETPEAEITTAPYENEENFPSTSNQDIQKENGNSRISDDLNYEAEIQEEMKCEPLPSSEIPKFSYEDDEDFCEEPLKPPEPTAYASRIDAFLEKMRLRISSPKKNANQAISSKVYQHLSPAVIDKYKSLNEVVQKIGVKQIHQLKYSKNLPKVSEDIALCYLFLFDIPVPKNRYWERFVSFLAQPGTVIQKFRQISRVLESNLIDPQCYAKISDILGKVPKNDLKLYHTFYELDLLVCLLKEVLEIVEIPELFSPTKKDFQIPTSRKKKVSESMDVTGMNSIDIIKSFDSGLLKHAISAEEKEVLSLKGQLLKKQWDEKRFLKQESFKEHKRDEQREIEIQKNTVSST